VETRFVEENAPPVDPGSAHRRARDAERQDAGERG
jgi:hypothetical protein